MDWNNEKVLDLIECYKNKTILWSPKHPKHYNKFAKSDAWEELATEMKTTSDDCKKKIISISASFRREKAKMKKSQRTGSGTEEVYQSTWFAFKSLAFIMDKDNPRSTLDSVDEEQVEIENQNKEPEDDVLQSTENLNDSVIFNTPSTHPKKKKKSDDDIMLDQAFSILAAAAKPVKETECSAYGKYIETKLQSFSPQTRNAVQHEFGNIIFKACQGFYEYNYPAYNMNQIHPLHMSLSNYNPSPIPSTYIPSSSSSNYNPSPIPSTCIPSPSSSIYNPSPIPSTYIPSSSSSNYNPSPIPSTCIPSPSSSIYNPGPIPSTYSPSPSSSTYNPSPSPPAYNTNPSPTYNAYDLN